MSLIKFREEVDSSYEETLSSVNNELKNNKEYISLNNMYNDIWSFLINNSSKEYKEKLLELDEVTNALNSIENKELYKQLLNKDLK